MRKVIHQFTTLPEVSISTKTAEFLIALNILQIDKKGEVVLSEEVTKFNMAMCPRCRTVILSQHRHDFVMCNCEKEEDKIFVDGGNDYHRYGGTGHIFPK